MSENQSGTDQSVTCTMGTDPLIRGAVFVLIFLGAGLYSVYELHKGKYADDQFNRNFTLAVAIVGIPLGLFFLIKLLAKMQKTLTATAETIGFKGQKQIPWSAINKIYIKSKGLMDLHYDLGGEQGVLKLDSWELRDFDKLTVFIESKTSGVTVEKAPDKK